MMKEKVFEACSKILRLKIEKINIAIRELSEDAASEVKSSAGDKHETGQAMMHLEQEKLSHQLLQLVEQLDALQKINIGLPANKVNRGSLVKTNKGYFFISVGLGKVIIDDDFTVFALSPASPLGAKLTGLQPGDSVEMNEIVYNIEEIF